MREMETAKQNGEMYSHFRKRAALITAAAAESFSARMKRSIHRARPRPRPHPRPPGRCLWGNVVVELGQRLVRSFRRADMLSCILAYKNMEEPRSGWAWQW